MCPCDAERQNKGTTKILDHRETKASLKTCMTNPSNVEKSDVFILVLSFTEVQSLGSIDAIFPIYKTQEQLRGQ